MAIVAVCLVSRCCQRFIPSIGNIYNLRSLFVWNYTFPVIDHCWIKMLHKFLVSFHNFLNMIDVLRNHTSYIPEIYMLKSWILQLFWHKNDGIAGWCEIKPRKYDQDSPPTKQSGLKRQWTVLAFSVSTYLLQIFGFFRTENKKEREKSRENEQWRKFMLAFSLDPNQKSQ